MLILNTVNIEHERSDKVTVIIHKTFQSIETLGLAVISI